MSDVASVAEDVRQHDGPPLGHGWVPVPHERWRWRSEADYGRTEMVLTHTRGTEVRITGRYASWIVFASRADLEASLERVS